MEIRQKLCEILPFVKKPIRYTGSELYTSKKKGKGLLKIALVFPDVYEIGESNVGLKILYRLVNKTSWAVAERAYIPWVDFIEKMRNQNIPLFSLETKRSLKDFDVVGFSLQSQLGYTNLLLGLELSNIPLFSKDRGKKDPLIIAGGPCTTNPLPLEPFVDAFVIGDGEEILMEILKHKKEISDRDELLESLSKIEGVWVPLVDGKDKVVKRRWVKELKEEDFPLPPVLPIADIECDRFTVEVSRGCTRGCRFCQAGYINRPVRYRSVEEIKNIVNKGIRATGWEEVSLLSFSIADYPWLYELLGSLNEDLEKKKIAISLPSFRGEAFTETLGNLLKMIKKPGLTFAPETSSPRLKRIINKNVPEEEILRAMRIASNLGWKQIKLYFMIGLPEEGEEDLKSIVNFISTAKRDVRNMEIKVHVSAFVPKPHTPFQWEQFEPIDSLKERLNFLKYSFPDKRIKFGWANPEASFVETILSRGDEKLASVILDVYRKGGIFQEWSEFFNLKRWMDSFQNEGIDPFQYVRKMAFEEPMPWDFIAIGIPKKFFQEEAKNAKREKLLRDCRTNGCYNCGVCLPLEIKKYTAKPKQKSSTPLTISYQKEENEVFYRIRYEVGEPYRYASHLDIVRLFYRALRRSELPISYTRGFSPHPKVAFGVPKPVGITSQGEYMDIAVNASYKGNLVKALSPFLPKGIRVYDACLFRSRPPSLTKTVNVLHYEIKDEKLPTTFKPQPFIHHISCKNGKIDLFLKVIPGISFYEAIEKVIGDGKEVHKLWIKRINMYIAKDGKLTLPMEVK